MAEAVHESVKCLRRIVGSVMTRVPSARLSTQGYYAPEKKQIPRTGLRIPRERFVPRAGERKGRRRSFRKGRGQSQPALRGETSSACKTDLPGSSLLNVALEAVVQILVRIRTRGGRAEFVDVDQVQQGTVGLAQSPRLREVKHRAVGACRARVGRCESKVLAVQQRGSSCLEELSGAREQTYCSTRWWFGAASSPRTGTQSSAAP